jgi:FKBP-type peptidyl-prolyl cis-trans isomerase FkpA
MRVILFLLPIVLLAQAPAPKPSAASPKPMTDDDKIVYSIGLSIYKSLGQFDLSPAEMELVKQALTDAAANKPAVDIETWGPKINTLASARASRVSSREKAADTVKVNYRGTLTNGTEFDSSYKRNEPAEFPLNQVIKCWTEGVQKMRVGGKSSLVCPSDIAYGDQGRPSIPGGATLVFEVELLEVSGAGAEPPK